MVHVETQIPWKDLFARELDKDERTQVRYERAQDEVKRLEKIVG